MPFDGGMTCAVVNEISRKAIGAKVEKICSTTIIFPSMVDNMLIY